jgi:hypothetical protein
LFQEKALSRIAKVKRVPQFIRTIKEPTKISLSRLENLIGVWCTVDIIKHLPGDPEGACDGL